MGFGAVTGGFAGGTELGAAHGSVVIDLDQLRSAAQTARQLGRQIEQSLGGISAGTQKAEAGIGSLSASLTRLGGAFGIVGGAAALVAITRFVGQSDALATSYRRQNVAAESLAGSQQKLNALLTTYDRVTGGVIGKAQALADVTSLQAIGFADTTQEMERFVTAARGISIATGRSLDYVISQLQLAIANQSALRLDQIGLGVDEVQNRVEQLKNSETGLTDAMVYQNAVLGLAEQKFGALVKSVEAQATGAEKARKAWRDLSLVVGETFGPAVSAVLSGIAREVDGLAASLQHVAAILAAIRAGDFNAYIKTSIDFGNAILGRAGPAATPGGGTGGQDPMVEQDTNFAARREARIDFARQIQEIERDANEQRLDATRSYESQRSQTISEYERTIAREAEDFGRQRLRAQEAFLRQIGDIEEAGRRRNAEMAADLVERIGELTSDSGQRIAEAQADTNKRIQEIEADYQRNRERAERDHRDRLFDAAARLDAVAVFTEQRNFKRQQADADEAHREQIDKLNDQLAERTQKEQQNLAERIAQEQRANAKRLAEAKAADDQRIADMREEFARRLAEEDADRAIRLARMAEDHAAQLAQQAAAQAERLAQIDRHAAEERKAAEDAHLKQMQELGGVVAKGWLLIQEAIQKAMLKSYDEFNKDLAKRDKRLMQAMSEAEAGPSGGLNLANLPGYATGGWVNRTGLAMVHQGEYVMNRQQAQRAGGSLTIGALNVYGTPGMNEQDLARAVRGELVSVLRGVAN